MRNTISWINIKRKKRNIEKIIIITKTQSDILRSEIIRKQENQECFISEKFPKDLYCFEYNYSPLIAYLGQSAEI